MSLLMMPTLHARPGQEWERVFGRTTTGSAVSAGTITSCTPPRSTVATT